jgi:hypothetical protein
MQKPPAGNIPGMTDTLDFVKKLWGSMSIPGANMASVPGMSSLSGIASPALTVEDLDKRIADLKAVEGWLNVNLSMLRGTIQTMEVQRSTLVTLKSMGASMAEAMRQSGVSADKMANTPFAPFFGLGAQGAVPAAAAAAATPAPAKPSAPPAAGAGNADAAADVPGAASAMPAAVAWWNILQEQFTQAVATAMTPPPPAADAGPPAAGTPAAGAPAAGEPSRPDAGPADHAAPANGRPRTRSRSDKT